MAGSLFRLETTEGVPAEPPTMASAVPNWNAGDTIPLGRTTLRVVAVRDDDADPASGAYRGGLLRLHRVDAEQVALIIACAECNSSVSSQAHAHRHH